MPGVFTPKGTQLPDGVNNFLHATSYRLAPSPLAYLPTREVDTMADEPPYEIRFHRDVKRDRKPLKGNGQMRQRIKQRIDDLAAGASVPDAQPFSTGGPGYFRTRIGDWRIVYRVHEDERMIVVIAMGHRRQVYETAAGRVDVD